MRLLPLLAVASTLAFGRSAVASVALAQQIAAEPGNVVRLHATKLHACAHALEQASNLRAASKFP